MISCDKVLMEDLCATMGDVFLSSPLDPTTTAEVDPHPDMDDDLKEYYRQVIMKCSWKWKCIETLQCVIFCFDTSGLFLNLVLSNCCCCDYCIAAAGVVGCAVAE